MGSFHQLSPIPAVSTNCFQDKHVSLPGCQAARASAGKEENVRPGPREVPTSAIGPRSGSVLVVVGVFTVYSPTNNSYNFLFSVSQLINKLLEGKDLILIHPGIHIVYMTLWYMVSALCVFVE